jgi:hypothetical protein
MDDAERYRQLADECLTKAAVAPDPDGRLHWLLVAEKWLTMAEQVQVRTERYESSTEKDG